MILHTTSSNMLGFTAVGRLSKQENALAMGAFIVAGDTAGIVANVEIEADPMVKELAASSKPLPAALIQDQRMNRIGRIVFNCLTIGTFEPDKNGPGKASGRLLKQLPPLPPLTLTQAVLVGNEGVYIERPIPFHYAELFTDKKYYGMPLVSILAAHYRYLKEWIDPFSREDNENSPANQFAASVVNTHSSDYAFISLFQRLL